MARETKPPVGDPAPSTNSNDGGPTVPASDISMDLVMLGLVESLSGGLIVLDRELRYVFWNPFMEKLTGIGADQVLGRRPVDLFPQIIEQGIDEMITRALSGETVESPDIVFREPTTGSESWIVGKYFPARNRKGRIVGVVALISDITKRKHAEEALAASGRDLALHNAIAEIFLTTSDDQMFENVLRVLLDAFESQFGIFGYIDDDGSLVVPSMTTEVLESCTLSGDQTVFPRDTWGGVWGEALTSRRSVLSNRPGSVPSGHIAIDRSIFVPIVDRDTVVGLLAVANRDRDYTADHLRELETIASHIGPILHARVVRDSLERERDDFYRALEASEARYRAIVHQQTDFVARFMPDGTLTFVNDALCSYAGATKAELIGLSLWEILSDEERHRTAVHLSSLTQDQPIGVNDVSWVTPEGETRRVSFVNHAFFDREGAVAEYQSVGRDITDRYEYEVDLERALAEKEVLLKEIHHRVKNNMAVISSLLSLHERDLAIPQAREVFASMRSRINSMSLVHEQLYRSGDFENVDFGSYVAQLARSLSQSQNDTTGRIKVEQDISSVTLDLECAVPCGLILTELMTNALKHAFPDRGTGTVRVSLRQTDTNDVELAVEDDGIGLESGDRSGFGLHMVDLLVRQLGGSITHEVEGGRRVEVRFPIPSG